MNALTNVHFLGAKSSLELGSYPQHFDVCIMPYRANAYTKYISPLKLHEYLASGRPVVGTRIRSLEEMEGPVVLVSGAEDEWGEAIASGLAPEAMAPARRVERQTLARAHDWSVLTARVASILEQRLGLADVRSDDPARSLPLAAGS